MELTRMCTEIEKKVKENILIKDRELVLTYCTGVIGLIDELKPNVYKAEEWRLS